MKLVKQIKWTFWLETGIFAGLITVIWMTAILVSQVQAQPLVDRQQDDRIYAIETDRVSAKLQLSENLGDMRGDIKEIKAILKVMEKRSR